MALQDILAAITAEADKRIAEARKAHQQRLTELREQSQQRTAKRKQEIAVQKDERKEQMRAKAQAHAQMTVRNAELQRKQDLLDQLYADVAQQLAALPEDKVEQFLSRCLQQIHGKGTIHPAKAHEHALKKLAKADHFTLGEPVDADGGFVFRSEKEERDYTFEHLVSAYLRPATEVEVAHQLFQ